MCVWGGGAYSQTVSGTFEGYRLKGAKLQRFVYTVPLVDLIRETSAADSTPHSEHPHPSPLEGPLVPPVLDLLEDVAASPLVLFVAFDLLHLFIQMKMSSIEEQQHALNFKKLKEEEKKLFTFPLSNSSSHSSITVSLLALRASSIASLLTAETSPSQLRTGAQMRH